LIDFSEKTVKLLKLNMNNYQKLILLLESVKHWNAADIEAFNDCKRPSISTLEVRQDIICQALELVKKNKKNLLTS